MLLGVIVLNICKYQLPYIEYNLFRDYIAENLCVKRFEANNDCQGQCFLNRQIELIDESDNCCSGDTNEKKQIAFDDYIVPKSILSKLFIHGIQLIAFVYTYDAEICMDIPVPPPQNISGFRFTILYC